jgi:hypothetical protein
MFDPLTHERTNGKHAPLAVPDFAHDSFKVTEKPGSMTQMTETRKSVDDTERTVRVSYKPIGRR